MRLPSLVAFTALALGLACQGTGPLPKLDLADGTSLYSSNGIAYIVLSPAHCVDCTRLVREWIAMRSLNPHAVRVILTREPTSFERNHIIIERVPIDGVLANEPVTLSKEPGIVYQDSSGVWQAIPVAASTMLLTQARTMTQH